MRRRALPMTLAAVLLLGGCSTKSDLQDMEQVMIAEFRELGVRQDSLEREVRRLRAALLDSLRAREGDAFASQGEVSRQLDRLAQQMGQVTALAGENQRMLARLERRIGASGGAAGAGQADAGPAGTREAEGGAAGDAAGEGDGGDGGSEPRQLYEASLQQFRRGSYQTARTGLEEFLSRFPEHDLAPDARFYVAETHAETGETGQALEAYSRVVELFPNSRRAASALYKSGLLELERGNVEDARVFFSRVVNGYPDSDEAGLARDQLRRLGEGG